MKIFVAALSFIVIIAGVTAVLIWAMVRGARPFAAIWEEAALRSAGDLTRRRTRNILVVGGVAGLLANFLIWIDGRSGSGPISTDGVMGLGMLAIAAFKFGRANAPKR